MAQLLLCLALADAFLGLAMAGEKVQTMVQSSTASSSPQQAPTQNLYDAQAPMIRRLGKHHHQKMVQTVVAPGLSPSLAPHQAPENVHSKRETSPLYQTKSSSEASSAEESVSIQVQATHLPNHHHSADKSIAGGGVILGGLATTFLVAVFCYIRAILIKVGLSSKPNRHAPTALYISRSSLSILKTPSLHNRTNSSIFWSSSLKATMANEKSVMAVIRAARPSFKIKHDKVAFAVHAAFLASGYALTATGPAAFSESAALSAPSTNEVGTENWNEVDGEYAFVYVNPDKEGKRMIMKCLAMNGKLAVSAISDGLSEPVNLEIDVGDYVAENEGTNYSEQYRNLDKLVKKLDDEILSKLDGPSTSSLKASSSGNRHGGEARQGSRQNNEPGVGFYGPASPQIPLPGYVVPPVPVNPMNDLYPGLGAGMYPPGAGRGGGMLIGPDDPSWSGLFGDDPGFPGRRPDIPPGARFDPFGPPGVPGFEPNRFNRGPRRPGSNIHPDLSPMGRDPDFI